MVHIVLIRPGSTDFDTQGRIQGTLDIPLSEQGQAEAQQLGEQLRGQGISAVYSSCCKSALQTAETIAAALDVKLKKLDRMQNVDHGLWQGMLIDDVKRKQPKVFRQWQDSPEIICPPEGEMLSQAKERVEASLPKLIKKNKDTSIALVLPEPLASVAKCYLTRSEIGGFWKGSSTCGSWECIAIDPNRAAAAPAESSDKNTAVTWRGASIKAG